MNQALRDAYAKREAPEIKSYRWLYVQILEPRLRALPQSLDVFSKIWKVAADSAAMYATQVGVSKEELLAWISESYDLYTAIIRTAGQDPQAVKDLINKEFLP